MHLTANRMKPPEPNIGLLRDRRVEKPAVIVAYEFWKGARVAVFLAEGIVCTMLAPEVEHVYRQPNVIKKWRKGLLLDDLCEMTVVVEYDVLWRWDRLIDSHNKVLLGMRSVLIIPRYRILLPLLLQQLLLHRRLLEQ